MIPDYIQILKNTEGALLDSVAKSNEAETYRLKILEKRARLIERMYHDVIKPVSLNMGYKVKINAELISGKSNFVSFESNQASHYLRRRAGSDIHMSLLKRDKKYRPVSLTWNYGKLVVSVPVRHHFYSLVDQDHEVDLEDPVSSLKKIIQDYEKLPQPE